MIDPNDIELAAMAHAGSMAGELLDGYTSTDLATWVPEQWEEFIAAICGGYVDYLVERRAAIENAVMKVAP